MKREDLYNLKKGDKVLVECIVEAVFPMGGFTMVTTRDCEKGFDAYTDEIIKSGYQPKGSLNSLLNNTPPSNKTCMQDE